MGLAKSLPRAPLAPAVKFSRSPRVSPQPRARARCDRRTRVTRLEKSWNRTGFFPSERLQSGPSPVSAAPHLRDASNQLLCGGPPGPAGVGQRLLSRAVPRRVSLHPMVLGADKVSILCSPGGVPERTTLKIWWCAAQANMGWPSCLPIDGPFGSLCASRSGDAPQLFPTTLCHLPGLTRAWSVRGVWDGVLRRMRWCRRG